MLTGVCHRVMGMSIRKAIAFIYAVIVSVVANVVFDFVRHPPHSEATEPIAAGAITSADTAATRVLLPTAPTMAAVSAAPITAAPSSNPPPADTSRPGPGSGGLY